MTTESIQLLDQDESNLIKIENPFLTSKVRRKTNSQDCRILFLYPNERGMSTIPPSITSLSQILKDEGHQTALFDTTFYKFDDEITTYENWIKPDTGDRCWINLKCTMESKNIKFNTEGFFKVAFKEN